MGNSTIPETVHLLLNHSAADGPDNPCLLAVDGRSFSYQEMAQQVGFLTRQLRDYGIGRNDRVAIVLPNGLEMAICFLSAVAAAAAAPLNPAYRRQEFAFYLDDLQPKALILLPGSQKELRELAIERDIVLLELLDDRQAGAAAFRLSGSSTWPPSADGAAHAGDIAMILHTSGTTSRPKMVPLSQANLCTSATNIAATLRLEPVDRFLNVMPLFHIHGLMAGLLAPMRSGSSVVCTPGFDAANFYGWLGEFEPSAYTAVPTMHQALLERAAQYSAVVAKSALRFIRSSSASLPPQVMAGLSTTFDCPVIESYGMTEASHQMSSNPLPPGEQKAGTVGLAAGPEVAIMEEDGASLLARGETGEIVIRGANVCSGYLANRAANEQAFVSGWFRTGDQGIIGHDGYLTITGRLKEIINRGGEKIAPREIDELLLSHPAVLQAVAFAIPDQRLGEEIGAAVILNPGQTVGERDLQRYVARRLADFKVPRKIIFVDEIPKGPTGKLQRVGLAEQLGIDKAFARVTAVADREADPRLEAFVAAQWREILNLDRVASDIHFLELGGASIEAARLVQRINSGLGLGITIVDLFDAPTVTLQALLIEDALLADLDAPREEEDAAQQR